MMRFSISLAGLLLGLAASAECAEIKRIADQTCNILIEGEIAAGDAKKLMAVDDAGDPGNAVCLNSPGGSWSEGIALAHYFRRFPKKTYIQAGHRCYSACAIAFMGGTGIGFNLSSFPERRLHIRAKLGFHAPYIVAPENRLYDKAIVEGQYRRAINDIADLIDLTQTRHGITGDYVMDPFIISISLRKPPDEFFMIDTVRKASLANIELVGAKLPALEKAAFINVCDNLAESSPLQLLSLNGYELSQKIDKDMPLELLRAPAGELEFSQKQDGGQTMVRIGGYGATVSIAFGSVCHISFGDTQTELGNGDVVFQALLTDGSEGEYGPSRNLHEALFYPPNTKLDALPDK